MILCHETKLNFIENFIFALISMLDTKIVTDF